MMLAVDKIIEQRRPDKKISLCQIVQIPDLRRDSKGVVATITPNDATNKIVWTDIPRATPAKATEPRAET